MRRYLLLAFLLGTVGLIKGQVHECLKFASRDANGICQCPPKQVGNGYFCCAGDGFDMCQLRGDPRLKSISGEKASVNYPCTHPVTEINEMFNGNTCNIKVFTSGDIVDAGYIRSYVVGFEISINDNGPERLTIKVNTFRAPGSSSDVNIMDDPGPHVFMVGGVPFEVAFDDDDNMWSLSGCHSVVRYRAPDGTAAIQPKIPGICVLSRQGKSTGNVADGNLCTLDDSFDKGIYPSRNHKILAQNLMNHMDLSDDQKLESDPMEGACNELDGYFRDCNSFQKPMAMEECGDIMLDNLTRKKLYNKGSNLFLVFCDCLAAFCSKSQTACDRLKADPGVQEHYPRAAQCDNWIGA